ncbi:MAG: histidine--tRNA ligase [Deltaproteobacteria bacterium]|nr:histidine--tRNA ligase [Deltaproteobacteria bacterium]
MDPIKLVKGFKDLLPEESAKWWFVELRARKFFKNFGFSEIRPPIMERTELFQRGIGEGTDVVEKEMYTFTDRSGENLTLRPEATAGVIRAYIENGLFTREAVSKLYTIGPMFRRERPQKGRFRQFHQINAEVFGVAAPIIDAEIIIMVNEFLRDVGLESLSLEINSLGCSECRPSFKQELIAFLEAKKETLCPDCQRRIGINPLRVLDCKVRTCQEATVQAPLVTSFLCTGCHAHFDELQKYINRFGITYSINPKMVRGLDYYTKTAFEITTTHLGAQNAVCGGGRYDELVKQLGGPDVPGIGFAIGFERLVSLLPMSNLYDNSPTLFVAPLGATAHEKTFALLNSLRLSGLSCVSEYNANVSLKTMLKRADRSGARLVIIVGEDELLKEEITIKDMQTGKQKSFLLSDWGKIIATAKQGEL